MNAIRAFAAALSVIACAGSTTSTSARAPGTPPAASSIVVSPNLVILPPSVAPDLLDQCTRHVPQGFEGTWSPSLSQARRIEELFTQRFDTATWCLTNYPPTDPPLRGAITAKHYALQLGGLILNGRRFVYVNGLPRWFVHRREQSLPPEPAATPEATRWHRQAVVVCDGASDFFGVLYDPAADTLGRIDFNADVVGGAWLCDEARQPRRMPLHN